VSLDVILSILIFFQIVIQQSDCYWVLALVCTAPMLRKSEILVILKSKQKSLCQLATTELYPNETNNRVTERKLKKCVWVLCFRFVHGSQSLKLKYENYKSVEILSNFQNVKSLCANVIPIMKNFLATILIWISHHFAWRFRCVRFVLVWKSNKHTNREPSSSSSWVRFTWRFCSCVWDFYSRGKRVKTWSPRWALTSLCHHTYVQCGLFLWAQIRKDRCKLTKM